MVNKNYPEEVQKYIFENYKGNGPMTMVNLIAREFGITYTRDQIHGFYGRNHLNSGVTMRFGEGQKMGGVNEAFLERGKDTRFKKGSVPSNKVPIGTVKYRSMGYKFRKVGPGCHDWRLEQRVVWEEHNGPIPKGSVIIFADGDPMNCDISNLRLVSRAVNPRVRKRKQYMKDYADAVIALSELEQKIYERKKCK